MYQEYSQIYRKPELHFSICSDNKALFLKFERALKKSGMIGIPDLQGNLHYIVDGRKGFPLAYKQVNNVTMQFMESRLDYQNQKVEKAETIADFLMRKYEFDTSLPGTKFIRYIIVYGLLDKSLLLSFSNYLYPFIAQTFHSTPEKIGYSVRYAFRKLEKKEAGERINNTQKAYFFDVDMKRRGNRTTIYKLIQEAESRMKISDENPKNKLAKKEKGYPG